MLRSVTQAPAAQIRDFGRLRLSHRMLRMPRHLRAVVHHSTPRRLANLVLAELERFLGLTRLRSKPYVIFVDPINLCNLRCPLCATGTGDIARTRKRMDLDHFRHVIDEVAAHAYEVSLYNWGEPLLHTHIFDMIAHARSKNLATVMSSHLSVPKPELMDRIVESGLEELTVSIDGTTQEVYEKYRVRGDLDLVFNNLRRLIARREEVGSRTPYIEWQFIVFKHNEHQVEDARRMAQEIGVDMIRFIPAGLPFEASPETKQQLAQDWFASNPQRRYQDPNATQFKDAPFVNRGRCYYLYRALTVNPDLGVAPCCVVYDERYDMGNLTSSSLDAMWNNDRFRSARAEFSRFTSGPGEDVPCTRCQIFDKPRKRFAATAQRRALPVLQTIAPSPETGAEEAAATGD